MTIRSASSGEVDGIAEDLDGVVVRGRVARAVNNVALGVAFLLAGAIVLVIAISALAVLYAVVRMAFGG